MRSSHMPREGARPGLVRDIILGHANIDVTQNLYPYFYRNARSVRWGLRFGN